MTILKTLLTYSLLFSTATIAALAQGNALWRPAAVDCAVDDKITLDAQRRLVTP